MNKKKLMAMTMTMVSFYVYDDANELLLLLLSRLNILTPPCHFFLPRNHQAFIEANRFCSDPFWVGRRLLGYGRKRLYSYFPYAVYAAYPPYSPYANAANTANAANAANAAYAAYAAYSYSPYTSYSCSRRRWSSRRIEY
jgi:hypothetical protein